MKPAAIFSSHMVLQCDLPVPVWGWSSPGDAITVELAGQKATAITDQAGKWTATLDPLPASAQPRDFVVHSKNENSVVTFTDVLVGEVWLASGQSNMQQSVGSSLHPAAEIAAAGHPGIRLFTVPVRTEACPPPDVEGAWAVCSPSTIPSFSGVAYFFGRELHRALGVPVGLVHASRGGTRVEAWTSKSALLTESPGRHALEEHENDLRNPPSQAELDLFAGNHLAWLRGKVIDDPVDEDFSLGWAGLDFDDSSWERMEIPTKWQSAGHDYCGVFWFRRVVDIPPELAGKEMVLHLGACDKHDTTWFNGVQVGATGWEVPDAWCQPRVYRIPGELVRAGRNVIATRVYSYMFDGGLIGPTDSMELRPKDDSSHAPIPLAGAWRYKVGHNFGPQQMPRQPVGPGNPNSPAVLYENMILPLAPCAMRGVIWYQGETNAWAPLDYRKLFPLMIRDWRQLFKQPCFPFLFVQLANYMAVQEHAAGDSNWAGLREAQSMALSEPATGMAVAIDIGEAQDIHPKNKQEVGRRLALIARAQVYGEVIEFSGPVFRSLTPRADSLRLHFDHAEGGLKTSEGGAPVGFALAGENGKFHWASARIDGFTITLRCEAVRDPVWMRYGWGDNPLGNLCNSAGLPASPFRAGLRQQPA